MSGPTLLLLLGALLPGCGSVGLDNSGVANQGGHTTLSSLDPAEGPVDHQTPVIITGEGFSGTITAWFGDEPAAVTRVDDTHLVAVAPALSTAGSVDVRILTDAGEATLSQGYTYVSADETGDTGADSGDSGTGGDNSGNSGNGGNGGGNGGDNGSNGGDNGGDTGDSGEAADTSGAGLVGGLVEFALLQIACPDCLGYTSTIQVTADAAFHTPTADGWIDWLPRPGTCELDVARTAPASRFLDAGEWAYLESGSTSVGLRQSGGIYSASGLGEADYVRSAGYDLRLADGGADLDAFNVSTALTTPQVISSLTPVEMLYSTPNTAFSAIVRASDATFTWGPSGGSDSFMLLVDVYSPAGDFLHEIVCLDGDFGTMTVPSGMFSGDPQNSLLVIGMYRYALGEFIRPDNASSVQTVTTFGVLGTGILKP